MIKKVFESAKGCQNNFPRHFLYPQGEGVCPCLPSILPEYPVYLGVVKPPTLSDNTHRKSYALCQSFIYILAINKCSVLSRFIQRTAFVSEVSGAARCLRHLRGLRGLRRLRGLRHLRLSIPAHNC